MYDETNCPGPEYRVRPVVRYIVTRYCHPYQSRDGSHGSAGQSTIIGEFDKEQSAHDVATALAKSESYCSATAQDGEPQNGPG